MYVFIEKYFIYNVCIVCNVNDYYVYLIKLIILYVYRVLLKFLNLKKIWFKSFIIVVLINCW